MKELLPVLNYKAGELRVIRRQMDEAFIRHGLGEIDYGELIRRLVTSETRETLCVLMLSRFMAEQETVPDYHRKMAKEIVCSWEQDGAIDEKLMDNFLDGIGVSNLVDQMSGAIARTN